MTPEVELVRAVLGELCRSDDQAQDLLDRAAALNVDPLDYCAHRFPLGATEVYRRAAKWCRFAFSPTIPVRDREAREIRRIDALAHVRSINETIFDREVTFSAPSFRGIVALRGQSLAGSPLRQSFCIVPPHAVRAALAVAASRPLLEEARQRLARRWPFTSAHLDLTLRARLVFAGAVLIVVAVMLAAPFWFKPLFVPLVGVLLIAPAVLKLLAAATPEVKPALPPLLSDAELPVYSVLIPLRDEAQMVPLLQKAMSALDYPALCIKRTNRCAAA